MLERPFPSSWLEILEENVRHYSCLTEAQQKKLRNLVQVFVNEKYWEGCGGQIVDDEVKVTIAGQACLLAIGATPNFYFDRVKTILVYPDVYRQPTKAAGGILETQQIVSGEAWNRGPVVLSWRETLEGGRNPHDGQNLVIHEFAHCLDGLDGYTDGIPPMQNRQKHDRWEQVTEREYLRLVRRARSRRRSLLDHYGATNKAEFFAVSSECFFECPAEMQEEHPELYEVLQSFYQLNPAEWAS